MTPEQFKAIRTKLGVSQTKLSKALRIKAYETISRYERNEREIPGSVARHMEEFKKGKPL